MEIFERGELAILTVNFKDENGSPIQPTNDLCYAYIYADENLYVYGQAPYLGVLGVFEYRWSIPYGVDRGVWHVDFQGTYGGEPVMERNEFRIKHSGVD